MSGGYGDGLRLHDGHDGLCRGHDLLHDPERGLKRAQTGRGGLGEVRRPRRQIGALHLQGAGAQLNSLTFGDGTVQSTAAPATAATYCAVANISNAQSIQSGSYTAVSFDTVVSDTESQFSGGTTFTAAQAGLYQIQGSVRIAADGASGYGMLTIYHNGNPCGGDSHPALSGAVSSLSVGMTLVLAEGDTIQLAYFQNSGSSVTTAVSHTSTVQFTAMSIALLANAA